MTTPYDALETRSPDERAADQGRALPRIIAAAQALAGNATRLDGVDAGAVTGADALAALPVLRKDELMAAQGDAPPFGGLASGATSFSHIFQSPGPIYEPGDQNGDWWRFGRDSGSCSRWVLCSTP